MLRENDAEAREKLWISKFFETALGDAGNVAGAYDDPGGFSSLRNSGSCSVIEGRQTAKIEPRNQLSQCLQILDQLPFLWLGELRSI